MSTPNYWASYQDVNTERGPRPICSSLNHWFMLVRCFESEILWLDQTDIGVGKKTSLSGYEAFCPFGSGNFIGPTFLSLQVCSTPGPDFPIPFSSISVSWVEIITASPVHLHKQACGKSRWEIDMQAVPLNIILITPRTEEFLNWDIIHGTPTMTSTLFFLSWKLYISLQNLTWLMSTGHYIHNSILLENRKFTVSVMFYSW